MYRTTIGLLVLCWSMLAPGCTHVCPRGWSVSGGWTKYHAEPPQPTMNVELSGEIGPGCTLDTAEE